MKRINQISFLLDYANAIIIQDRERYQSTYDVVHDFIKKNGGYLGGNMGINLMLDNQRSIEDYRYDIFTTGAVQYAMKLANVINDIFDSRNELVVVTMRTLVPFTTLGISVDNREFIYVHNLTDAPGKQSIAKMIKPIKCKFFDRHFSVDVMPPEFYLMEIYRSLYSPNRAGEWEKYFEASQKIINAYVVRARARSGGAEMPKVRIESNTMLCSLMEFHHMPVVGSAQEPANMELITDYIMNKYAPTKLLVGPYAAKLLGFDLGIKQAPQVVTDNIGDLENIRVALQGLGVVTIYKNEIKYPHDIRLERHVVRVDNYDVLYLYPVATYDLLPYKEVEGYKVGTLPTLSYFMSVDVWALKWLGVHSMADYVINGVVTLQKNLTMEIVAEQDTARKFYGEYYPERFYLRQLSIDSGKRVFDYNPAEYKRKFGKYREFGNHDNHKK